MDAQRRPAGTRDWVRSMRVTIAAVAAVFIQACLLVGLWPGSARNLRDTAWILAVGAVAALPFGLYAWLVRGKLASIITGLLLLIPTVVVLLISTWELVRGSQGGAGGALFWLGVPTVIFDYLIAIGGSAIDAMARSWREAGERLNATSPDARPRP